MGGMGGPMQGMGAGGGYPGMGQMAGGPPQQGGPPPQQFGGPPGQPPPGGGYGAFPGNGNGAWAHRGRGSGCFAASKRLGGGKSCKPKWCIPAEDWRPSMRRWSPVTGPFISKSAAAYPAKMNLILAQLTQLSTKFDTKLDTVSADVKKVETSLCVGEWRGRWPTCRMR